MQRCGELTRLPLFGKEAVTPLLKRSIGDKKEAEEGWSFEKQVLMVIVENLREAEERCVEKSG